mmetsp:Transcript_20818/g.58157  ORF Transcript_20818/g.58157 Transcript_20818/m.58157 type:complete len:309 (+) Transcript_20818:371-1297(+)
MMEVRDASSIVRWTAESAPVTAMPVTLYVAHEKMYTTTIASKDGLFESMTIASMGSSKWPLSCPGSNIRIGYTTKDISSKPQMPSQPMICTSGKSTSLRSHSSAMTCAAWTTCPRTTMAMPITSVLVSPPAPGLALPPQMLAKLTNVTPTTHRNSPSQLKPNILRLRHVIARMAAKTISHPRSICHTLAGMYNIPTLQRPVASRSNADGMEISDAFFQYAAPPAPSAAWPGDESVRGIDKLPFARHELQKYTAFWIASAKAIPTNMLYVANHGFLNSSSSPEIPTLCIVNWILIVMVLREPNSSMPPT